MNGNGIEVLIDIRTCGLKRSEVMAFIDRWKAEHPGQEIWLDGDAYGIVTWKGATA